jgi:hypothetical protein
MERLNIVCGTSIATGLAVHAPEWSDFTTPRTDAPVRFIPAKFAYWYARWQMREDAAAARKAKRGDA